MQEFVILKNWVNQKEKMVFWGASERACCMINNIIKFFPEELDFSVVDTKISGGRVELSCGSVAVQNPHEYLGRKCKWVICVSNKQSYAEVYHSLSENGYQVGEDFFDATLLPEDNWVYPHGDIIERNVYMPWVVDEDFISIRRKIEKNTLVDEYRCFELWKLVEQSRKCESGNIMEVGVWRGGTGALLAAAAKHFDIASSVYLFDTFEGVVKTENVDVCYRDGAHSDTSEEIVRNLLKTNQLENAIIKKGIFPDDFSDEFKDMVWRFVHIDVDVYRSAKEVFEYVWRNVLPGGCVVFDDYGYRTTVGVTKLCNELAAEIIDGVFIYNLNQHAVFVKMQK